MKLKYFYLLLLAICGVMTSCSDDNDETRVLGDLQVSSSYVTLNISGGQTAITVTSAADWTIVAEDVPQWLTITPMTGTAGTTKVIFSAEAGLYGQVASVRLQSGANIQEINVQQGLPTPELATCKEIIDGPEGKSFRVKGTVKSIANTTYGNWYLQDETGEVYIYGTLDKDGKTKNFSSLGIEVGDVVTVEGPKKLYGSTVELVDVTVVEIEKTLVKILSGNETNIGKEGGELKVEVEYKGIGLVPAVAPDCNWIHFVSMSLTPGTPSAIDPNPASKAVVLFNVDANPDVARTGVITFESSQLTDNSDTGKQTVNTSAVNCTVKQEAGVDPVTPPTPAENATKISVADFNAAAESTDVWYMLTGTVTNLKDGDMYGNFDLVDETGSVYVYGLLSEKGGEKKKFQELVAAQGIKEGTKITIIGNRGSYNGKIEVMNAYFVCIGEAENSNDPAPSDGSITISVADFNAAAESTDVWYKLTGTISNLKDNDQYGNFDLTDESGSVYVYGVLSEKGGEKKKFQDLVTAHGIKNGTTITIIGNRGSYNGKIEVMNAYFVSATN